jgi:hypothetical protein
MGVVVLEIDQLGLSSTVTIYLMNFLIALLATFGRRSRVENGVRAGWPDYAMTVPGLQEVTGILGLDDELQETKVEQELQKLREAAGKKELEERPWKQQEDRAERNEIIDDQIEAEEKNQVQVPEVQPDAPLRTVTSTGKKRRHERREDRRFWAGIVYNFALTSLGSAVSLLAPHFVQLQ